MLNSSAADPRRTEYLRALDDRERTTGWSWAEVPRGPRLVLLIGASLLLMVATLIFGDSAFSNWGVEANSGWQLISNGHYTLRILAGARTDQNAPMAFIRGGHTLVVDYDVTVQDGSAFFAVDPSFNVSADALYYESIEHDQKRHLEIPIKKTGLYDINMSYYSYRGTIDVKWHVD